MESERFNVWLQMIGMAGIIASLMFVGLQLKQSQDIAIASQYTERASEAREYWQFVAEQPRALAGIGATHRDHLKALNSYRDDLTDEEIGQLFVNGRVLLVSWDNNYYQYKSGFMTYEGWAVYEDVMGNGCSVGGLVNSILANHRSFVRSSLAELWLQYVDD